MKHMLKGHSTRGKYKSICRRCGCIWMAYVKHPKKCQHCHSLSWKIKLNQKCEICMKHIFVPITHHINKNHQDNNKDNKMLVCLKCHSLIHGWRKYQVKNLNIINLYRSKLR